MNFLNFVQLLDEIDPISDYDLDILRLIFCAIPVIIILAIILIVKKKNKKQIKGGK